LCPIKLIMNNEGLPAKVNSKTTANIVYSPLMKLNKSNNLDKQLSHKLKDINKNSNHIE